MCIPRQKVVKEPPAVTGYGIWNLAQRGDEAVLEKMLASEESTKEHLNCAYGISLRTPLMAAIHWGHSRRAVMLLQAGASINKQDVGHCDLTCRITLITSVMSAVRPPHE